MSYSRHSFLSAVKRKGGAGAPPFVMNKQTHTLTSKSHDHLGHLAFDVGRKFFVGEHDRAVGEVDHDEAAGLFEDDVEQELAVVEGGTRAGQVGQLVAQGFAGVLPLEDGLDDLAGGKSPRAVARKPIVDDLAAFLHDAGKRVLLAKRDANGAKAGGDFRVGGGVVSGLHDLDLRLGALARFRSRGSLRRSSLDGSRSGLWRRRRNRHKMPLRHRQGW